MTRDDGCALYLPHRARPERAASILRQARAWHGGGPVNPRIADLVHYLWCDSPRRCHAAVVTELASGGRRGLMVIHPAGADWVREVPYASLLGDRQAVPGTWHGMDECGPVDPEAAGEVR